MKQKSGQSPGIKDLLHGPHVRREVDAAGQTVYAAVDVVRLLSDSEEPEELWQQLKNNEPRLTQYVEPAEFPNLQGFAQSSEGFTIEGVLRLVESIPGPKAERIKKWLAQSGARRLAEAENPELAALRARRLYERRGYSRRWVDKRLRGISTRQELTGEWYKRGASDSEQFRGLTNRLMHSAFGMDVEGYRRYKSLARAGQNLRDSMSELELALTSLAETAAVALHQARDSHGTEQLERDVNEAGEIVAETRKQIEQRSGRQVIESGPRPPSRPQLQGTAELANEAKDRHNLSPSPPMRTVA